MNMNMPFPQFQQQQSRYSPPIFMQPQGNVYMIENSLELANVPMGAGVSIALCPSESLMYLKMYQNGTPQIAAYTIMPYEKKENEIENSKLQEIITRIETIEEKISNKKGGQLNGLL